MNNIKIFNDNGQIWAVRITCNHPHAIQDELVVAFFDCRHEHSDLGQFVSDYYLSTILNHDGGLVLDGGVKSWWISAPTMDRVRGWLHQFVGEAA